MQNSKDSIDLDALFDSLNISEGQSGDVAKTSDTSYSDVNTVEIQGPSLLDMDLLLFDAPTDQS